MSRNDLSNLFDRLDAMSLGFTPLFRDLQTVNSNYPPHNIIRISDEEILLELAMAGFKKDEVELEQHQSLLTIKGNRPIKEDLSMEVNYQHRGIANRSFTKQFRIAEYFDIKEATMEDGILTVTFIKNVPEEAKPKLIAIK